MRYELDHELRYCHQLEEGLSQYNLPFIGVKPSDQCMVYILDSNGRVVAAAQTRLNLDWVSMSSMFYEGLDVGRVLMSSIVNHYRDVAVGIKIKTNSSLFISDLSVFGFQVAGVLKHVPKEVKRYVTTHSMDPINCGIREYVVKTSNKSVVKWYNDYNKDVQRFQQKYSIHAITNPLVIACFDAQELIGGIYGYMEGDLLYTQLLHVDERYRSNKIGTTLMQKLEQVAKAHGATAAYVSTISFQAYEFYIKQGYREDFYIDNKPIGFKEFTFSKELG